MQDKFIHSLDDVREEQEALLERQQDPDFALASDYAVGALSEDQAREVRARIERDPAFRDLVDPLLLLAERGPRFTPPLRQDVESGWRRLLDRVRRTSDDPQLLQSLAAAREARARRRMVLWSAAAVLAVFVILPAIPVVYDLVRSQTHRVPSGSTEVRDLGGGSRATLSSGSSMSQSPTAVDSSFYFFAGDADFEIVPGGKTFVLHTRAAEIIVVGTRFHVHGYPDEPTTVTVTEGTVEVWGIDDVGARFGRPLAVSAGQRAITYRGKTPEMLP